MLFSSLIFVCAFFPLFFALYYLLPKRSLRNALLLVFSLIFYAWGRVVYLPLILAASLVGWGGGLAIGRFREKNRPGLARASLVVSLMLLLGMLGVFKYAGFFAENFNLLAKLDLPVPEIVLPIGISFYTFQILSYVADVYRGEVKAQKNPGIVMVYLCAFPQLIAGPVVRYKTVEEELTGREVTRDDVYAGLRRFVAGLGKKVLIANVAAAAADGIFGYEASSCGAIAAWVGALAYTVQIYFDFSGYSDMAIGMGLICGLHYKENFNYPYISQSVSEFWRRWHISLCTFFRDYLYFPLGGSRCSVLLQLRNLFVVWFLTGLWHGAGWNYILWGLYWGVMLVIQKFVVKNYLSWLPAVVKIFGVTLISIFGMTIFQFTDLNLMLIAFKGLFTLNGNPLTDFGTEILFKNNCFLLIIGLIATTPIFKIAHERLEKLSHTGTFFSVIYSVAEVVIPLILFVLAVNALAGDSYNPFIYFQF